MDFFAVPTAAGEFRADDGSRFPGFRLALHGLDVTRQAIFEDLEIIDVLASEQPRRGRNALRKFPDRFPVQLGEVVFVLPAPEKIGKAPSYADDSEDCQFVLHPASFNGGVFGKGLEQALDVVAVHCKVEEILSCLLDFWFHGFSFPYPLEASCHRGFESANTIEHTDPSLTQLSPPSKSVSGLHARCPVASGKVFGGRLLKRNASLSAVAGINKIC